MDTNSSSGGIERRRFVKIVGASGIGASLAGCSGSDGGNDDNTVEMAMSAANNFEENEEAMQEALWDNGLSDDIEISITSTSTEGRQDQYQQWLSSGRSNPDILQMDVGWSIPFIERGQLLNLSENMSDDNLNSLENDFFDASIRSSTGSDGDLYGVPLFPDFGIMMYRKDLAQEAGYDPEGENWATEPMTWQEFSQITADVQEQAGLDYGFTFPFDLSQTIACCTFNEYISQWGGAYFGGRENLFGPVGDRPITVTEEPVLQALRMIRTFIYGHDDEHSLDNSEFAGNISPDGVLGWRYTQDLEAFINENAFAYRTWPGFLSNAVDAYGDNVHEQIGVMPFPYAVSESESQYDSIGGTMTSFGGWNLSINPNSEQVDQAIQVLEAAMTDDFYLTLWEIAGTLPPKPDLMESEEAAQDPEMGPYLDTISVAGQNAIPRPVTPIYSDEADAIAQEVHDTISRNQSPEEGMANLESKLQSLEEGYQS